MPKETIEPWIYQIEKIGVERFADSEICEYSIKLTNGNSYCAYSRCLMNPSREPFSLDGILGLQNMCKKLGLENSAVEKLGEEYKKIFFNDEMKKVLNLLHKTDCDLANIPENLSPEEKKAYLESVSAVYQTVESSLDDRLKNFGEIAKKITEPLIGKKVRVYFSRDVPNLPEDLEPV
jgi:hypothetical protein